MCSVSGAGREWEKRLHHQHKDWGRERIAKKTEGKASSCVTLDKTLPLSESWFPHLEKGTIDIYLLWALVVWFEKLLRRYLTPRSCSVVLSRHVGRWYLQWAPTGREIGSITFPVVAQWIQTSTSFALAQGLVRFDWSLGFVEGSGEEGWKLGSGDVGFWFLFLN